MPLGEEQRAALRASEARLREVDRLLQRLDVAPATPCEENFASHAPAEGHCEVKRRRRKVQWTAPPTTTRELQRRLDETDTFVRERLAEADKDSKRSGRAAKRAFEGLADLVVREVDAVRDQLAETNRIQTTQMSGLVRRIEEQEVRLVQHEREIKTVQTAQKSMREDLNKVSETLRSTHDAKQALFEQFNQLVSFVVQSHADQEGAMKEQRTEMVQLMREQFMSAGEATQALEDQVRGWRKRLEQVDGKIENMVQSYQATLEFKINSANSQHSKGLKQLSSKLEAVDSSLLRLGRDLDLVQESLERHKTLAANDRQADQANLNALRQAFKLLHSS